jgi:hypothetical protein
MPDEMHLDSVYQKEKSCKTFAPVSKKKKFLTAATRKFKFGWLVGTL